MSVQFGMLRIGRAPKVHSDLDQVSLMLRPWAPDGIHIYVDSRVTMLYGAFHVSRESQFERQPFLTPSGAIVTWDGCLDNRSQLASSLTGAVAPSSPDVSIVAAVYQAWGGKCFAKLIGDWAVVIWDPHLDTVLLARDALGKRHLYYSLEGGSLIWSTVLDPLVQLGRQPFAVSEEYLAGWVSFFPAADLTPYLGIRSVPPSSAVLVEAGRQRIWKYWDFDPAKRIVPRSDRDCEEQFRELFSQAVGRTLRSDRPVLAELSGGMDSSSIVCMADELLERGLADAPRLDTISYYDDTEPDWDERPYFTRIEQLRGSEGFHIDLSSQDVFALELDRSRFDVVPGAAIRLDHSAREYRSLIEASGARIVLSGLGGDEVLGGVPTPLPELIDLFVTFRWRLLCSQLTKWAFVKKRPWFHLLGEVFAAFLPPSLVGLNKMQRPVSWIDHKFIARNWTALTGYRSRIRLSGGLPSFQDGLSTIAGLRRSIATIPLPSSPCYVKRYPFLDRDLLEFLISLPPEQQVRPGERRSLMRRALADLVPPEILGRRRKAFVNRTLVTSLSKHLPRLLQMVNSMESVAYGIVDRDSFKRALQSASAGADVSPLSLFRTLVVEAWLEHMVSQGIVHGADRPAQTRRSFPFDFWHVGSSAETTHTERR